MQLTEKQKEYLKHCNHRWNVKYGATGSGKSFLDYSYTIPKRIMSLKGEGLCVMLGNTRGTLERNILEPMRNIWSADLVGNIRSDNTVMLFGKKVYALGADTKKHVSRIQGATFEYVYGDEITTWNQEVFEMLKSRLRAEHSIFDGTCNPATPTHWFKKFLDGNADIYQQGYTIDDGALPQNVIDALKQEYAGTVFYGRFIEGKWVSAEGLVYGNFSEERHVVDSGTMCLDSECFVSCDYGIQNATVFLLWQREILTGRWICTREYYYSGRDERREKTVSEHADGLEDMLNGMMPKQVIIDPSAAALIVELRRRGIHCVKANNEVIEGINDVSSLLQRGTLLFDKSCKHTIKEFGLYSWDSKAADNGVDAPIKENDHAMDAVRYFVKTRYLLKRTNS